MLDKKFLILVLFFTSCFTEDTSPSSYNPIRGFTSYVNQDILESKPLLNGENQNIEEPILIDPETIKYKQCLARDGDNCSVCLGYDREDPICGLNLKNVPDCLIVGPNPNSCQLCRHGYILNALEKGFGKCFPLKAKNILKTCSHPYNLDRRHNERSFLTRKYLSLQAGNLFQSAEVSDSKEIRMTPKLEQMLGFFSEIDNRVSIIMDPKNTEGLPHSITSILHNNENIGVMMKARFRIMDGKFIEILGFEVTVKIYYDSNVDIVYQVAEGDSAGNKDLVVSRGKIDFKTAS
jgi:hypothetical protein